MGSKLMNLCERVIEDAGKASERPWSLSDDKGGYFGIENEAESADWIVGPNREFKVPKPHNATYIVTSANSAETLAKAVKMLVLGLRSCDIALKAAKPCVNGGEHMNDRIAEEALAQAEALVEGSL